MIIIEFIIESVVYYVFELCLEPIGARARWLFFKLIGRPRRIEELTRKKIDTRRRTSKKRAQKKPSKEEKQQEAIAALNAFIGLFILVAIFGSMIFLI